MTLPFIVTAFAYACLLISGVLLLAARSIGASRAAAWMVVIGLCMLTIEVTAFTFWLGLADPQGDRDGMATIITPPARAGVLDSAVFGTAFFVLLGWLAMTHFARGEPWARGALLAAWVVTTTTLVVTMLCVYSRGLPLPTPGGAAEGAGFGWEMILFGLLSWAMGLWLHRKHLLDG
jgi:hypothetical protein